ncbi:MAG TPA: lactonase family protein [Isosphaeraceae bacterium]|jgi:6-phosphogluconolactonase|nr:lactonase family protein [Isosphaeraceae bacterium]
MLSIALLLGAGLTSYAEPQAASQPLWVYVGTYTKGTRSRGIYLLELDPGTGMLSLLGVAGQTENPSFLAIHPSRKYLYAVNEVDTFSGEKSGAVSAFAIDSAAGTLKPLNQEASKGQGPCYVAIDREGKNALVANYGGGSVAVLPIQSDGKLSPASASIQHEGSSVNPQRQSAPHAHSINLDAANHYAVAADLGLDKLLIYAFDGAKGTLTPNVTPSVKVAPGAGPRHFAFHRDGRHAYVINEINSTVTVFDYDASQGSLKELQSISTLPERYPAGKSHTAEVQVHPSGKFLYGSNRGHDSIAIFAIDADSGQLRAVGYQSTEGKTPRNFGIDPTGRFLLAANQGSNTIVVFRIDPATGELQPTGQSIGVPAPVCVKFMSKSQ